MINIKKNLQNVTGIVRRFDGLGRIVIPKEMRKRLEIDTNTPMEIFVQDDQVILKKYNEVDLETVVEQFVKRLRGFVGEGGVEWKDFALIERSLKQLKTKAGK